MPHYFDIAMFENYLTMWHTLFAYALTAGLLWTSGFCAVLTSPSLSGGLIFSINLIACISYILMILNTLYTVNVAQSNLQTVIRLIDWVITFPLIQIEILFLWGYKVTHTNFNQLALLLTFLALLVVLIQAYREFSPMVAGNMMLSRIYFLTSVFLFSIQLVVVWTLERRACHDDFSCNFVNFSFVFVWLLYPVITVFMEWLQPNAKSTLFFTLDALTCGLDVYSKAFLATVVAVRAES